ncbi:MAG: MgtC/SapB family protein [Clostridiales bacterium]|nr:MgtC/SapB family protein [Clostridiales bacterium]
MTEYLMTQLGVLLKLVAAGICGAIIGYERKSRLKEAGIRTHMLVAFGATLIMIVSKYGFSDVLRLNGYELDPSRVASQIVSGIGFLGAGMIFIKKQSINGLTTAAGIWTTAGIGMSIGAGLYFPGIAATVMVFLVQEVLHRNFKWIRIPTAKQMIIKSDDSRESISFIQEKLSENHIEIIDLKAGKSESGMLEIELYVKMPSNYDASKLLDLLNDNPHIKLIEY